MRGVLLVVTFSLLAMGAAAEHSYSNCSDNVTSIGAGPAMLYLVTERDDGVMWIYAESNGHPELQRGGAAWYELGFGGLVDANCWDIEAETGWPIDDPDLIVL